MVFRTNDGHIQCLESCGIGLCAFVPCDITYIPSKVVSLLHHALNQDPRAMMSYVAINGTALYPFCLMKRSSAAVIKNHLDKNQLSIKRALADLHAQVAYFRKHRLFFIASIH